MCASSDPVLQTPLSLSSANRNSIFFFASGANAMELHPVPQHASVRHSVNNRPRCSRSPAEALSRLDGLVQGVEDGKIRAGKPSDVILPK
jgi:hypothetical protein